MNTDTKYHVLMVIVSEKMVRFTAIDVMRMYQKVMHETINWHEFSYLLDEWNTIGLIHLNGHNRSGMCIYSFNR